MFEIFDSHWVYEEKLFDIFFGPKSEHFAEESKVSLVIKFSLVYEEYICINDLIFNDGAMIRSIMILTYT